VVGDELRREGRRAPRRERHLKAPLFPDGVAFALGTYFGSGLLPRAPGTWGSIAAALTILVLPDPAYAWFAGAGALLVCAFGFWPAEVMMRRSRLQDPQSFVLDEAAGVWIAAWRPENPGWLVIVIALVFFRVLDILKPWPIGALERLPGGWGVVYDDIAAGVGALLLSLAAQRFFL
jgi:phosphatidylglycerophosphatase A